MQKKKKNHYYLCPRHSNFLSLSPGNTDTLHTGRLSAGPMAFWAGTSESLYLLVLCLPLESSFQRKEEIIKGLNGLIWVEINNKKQITITKSLSEQSSVLFAAIPECLLLLCVLGHYPVG